jgi:hypothetical protein
MFPLAKRSEDPHQEIKFSPVLFFLKKKNIVL